MYITPKTQLLQNFLEWSGSQPDIRAVALVGSGARLDHPADEWSDYDLLVVASDPQIYFSSSSWLTAIGNPWFDIFERLPNGEPIERRVLFEDGHDIDFIVLSVENARLGFQNTPMVLEILQRGCRVLLDKDSLLDALPSLSALVPSLEIPSSQTFLEVVNDFWFHAAWTAKKLRRGELWVAKSCCDHYLKSLLLHMVEWEARSVHGWEFNTWFNGRFLEEWALPGTVEELHQVFAHYTVEDVWRALSATMKLFRRIACETANRLGYPYPADGDQQLSSWIAEIRPGIQ